MKTGQENLVRRIWRKTLRAMRQPSITQPNRPEFNLVSHTGGIETTDLTIAPTLLS